MSSATTQLLYTPAEGKHSLASSMGGVGVKPAQREAYNERVQNRIQQSVALIDTSLRFKKGRVTSAELVLADGEPTASGRLRLTKLYKPFDVSVFGGQARLVTAEICTYLPSRGAVGGRHWFVLSEEIFSAVESQFNKDDLAKDAVRVKAMVLAFTSHSGTIDGQQYSDIFIPNAIL